MKTITRSQYHQLVGLLALAGRHTRALKEILAAVLEITDDQERGLIDEVLHGAAVLENTYAADSLLRRLNITVIDPTEAGRR